MEPRRDGGQNLEAHWSINKGCISCAETAERLSRKRPENFVLY